MNSKPSIKIVRIITRLNVGGPAINAVLLANGLKECNFETVLVRGAEHPTEGNMNALAAAHGVSPVLIPELSREPSPSRDLAALYKLWRIIRREKPAIVHTHTAKAGTLGRLAARLAGVPIIVHTFHGHVLTGYFGPLKSRTYTTMEKILASMTTRIVTVGEAVKKDLVDLGVAPIQKFHVVPLGLDLHGLLRCESHRGRLRADLGLSEDHLLVGIVARLVPIKAHGDFLEAARRVSEKEPRARFIIVGDGELRGELEASVQRMRLSKIVHFLGIREDMDVVYADLDVVALTSLNEGLPISIIEAMAAARPVVATDVGSVRELVVDGETGFVVPARDTEAQARAILTLLLDEALRDRMGQAARRQSTRFSVPSLLANTAKLYDELLREAGVMKTQEP